MGGGETQELWGTIWGTNLTKQLWDKIKVHMEKNNPEHHWEDSLEILLGILLGNRTSKPKQFSKFLLTPHWTPRVPTLERKKACCTNLMSCLPNIFLSVFNNHFLPWLKYLVFDSMYLFQPMCLLLLSFLTLFVIFWLEVVEERWVRTPTTKKGLHWSYL